MVLAETLGECPNPDRNNEQFVVVRAWTSQCFRMHPLACSSPMTRLTRALQSFFPTTPKLANRLDRLPREFLLLVTKLELWGNRNVPVDILEVI